MSSKSMVWVVAVVLVLAAVWFYFGRTSMQQVNTAPQNQQTENTQATNDAQPTDGSVSVQSDTSLDADLDAIDTQAAAAADASASANSTTDTPVAQTE